MARQKKSKIASVIMWLLLLLLLVGGIGAGLYFTGIGKDDITDIVKPVFRIEYDGKIYKSDKENTVILSESGLSRFKVKCANTYTVAILPNVTPETDFSYTVNGKTYQYSNEPPLSSAFDLKCYNSAFTVNINDCSLKSVLSKIWGVDTVEITTAVITNPYKIVVTSSDGEEIALLFGGENIYSIVPILDKTEIVL